MDNNQSKSNSQNNTGINYLAQNRPYYNSPNYNSEGSIGGSNGYTQSPYNYVKYVAPKPTYNQQNYVKPKVSVPTYNNSNKSTDSNSTGTTKTYTTPSYNTNTNYNTKSNNNNVQTNWYNPPINNKCKYGCPPPPPPPPKPVCKPICNITIVGSSSGEAPFIARFSGRNSRDQDGRVTNYEWNFGDGSTGSGQDVSHTYNNEGTFNVTLRVRDNQGNYSDNSCRTTVTVNKKENDIPRCDHISASDRSGDAPLRVRFEGFGTDDNTSSSNLRYIWDFGDGDTANGKVVNHTFDDDDREFRVRLDVEDDEGRRSSNSCETTIRTNQEEDDDLVCRFDLDKDVNYNSVKVKVDASDSEGKIDKYEWDFDDDDEDEEGVKADHTYRDDGNFTIRLTLRGENGDVERCSKNLRINVDKEDNHVVRIVKEVEAKTGGEVKGVSSPKTGSNSLMIGLTLFMVGIMLKSLLMKIKAVKKYNY